LDVLHHKNLWHKYCFPAQRNNWTERTLRTSDGFNLGALCVIDTQPHVCTDAERAALTDLAATVIDLIELRLVHENLNCELSERAKTQEQIRSSEEKFRSVTQSVGDGIISSNKTGEMAGQDWMKRAAIRGKEIALPTIDKFNALIAEMRAGHSRDSQNCADLAEGLAFTGCRKGEASEIEWRDFDFDANFDASELVVRGDAMTGTKNWEVRCVPLIPDARALFRRMRSERSDEPLDAKVFRVRECQKSLDRIHGEKRSLLWSHCGLRTRVQWMLLITRRIYRSLRQKSSAERAEYWTARTNNA